MEAHLEKTLDRVAWFYDQRKVGHVGPLGFRRSTDLSKMRACLDKLVTEGIILPGRSKFLDLGCADGRVNVFLSYLLSISVGIELDEWTLDDYVPLKNELDEMMRTQGLLAPRDNIFLFHGDALDETVHQAVATKTGCGLQDFDIFYTYLVMHDAFSRLIAEKARPGAFYLVFGLGKILPKYDGLRLLNNISPLEGILAVYQKEPVAG